MSNPLSLIDVRLQRNLSLLSKVQPEINNNKITYHSTKGAEGKQSRVGVAHAGTAAHDAIKQMKHKDRNPPGIQSIF